MGKIEKILDEYGLTVTSSDDVVDDIYEFIEDEALELKEVCRNEDGMILMEYNNGIHGGLLSIETACELFPEHVNEIDINKNYLIMYENNIITE